MQFLPKLDLSHPRRHAWQHGFRADPDARNMRDRRQHGACGFDGEHVRATGLAAIADAPAWEPSGDDFLSGTLMEAECMRVLLPGERIRSVVRPRSCPISKREPGTLFYARNSQRPQRRQDRASRWTESQPRLVHEAASVRYRRRSARRRSCAKRRSATSRQRFRTSRATTWASIGSRPMRCWHLGRRTRAESASPQDSRPRRRTAARYSVR